MNQHLRHGDTSLNAFPSQRPPPRNAGDSWSHDMYGAGNNAQSRVVHVPRNDAATNTRLVVTNVHYEVTVDDLKVSVVQTTERGIVLMQDASCRHDHSRTHYSSKDPTLYSLSHRLVLGMRRGPRWQHLLEVETLERSAL
jgi:hypothetical protein